jgi:hypothetical protein
MMTLVSRLRRGAQCVSLAQLHADKSTRQKPGSARNVLYINPISGTVLQARRSLPVNIWDSPARAKRPQGGSSGQAYSCQCSKSLRRVIDYNLQTA